ncbi:UNVERIFIED_CONTAM: hypothetical protein HDU68_008800 [Siphonaria sp. JEL0065]|nr:hypothetical protein HDU68_008800 [Siphonaria sp. JEL0065]
MKLLTLVSLALQLASIASALPIHKRDFRASGLNRRIGVRPSKNFPPSVPVPNHPQLVDDGTLANPPPPAEEVDEATKNAPLAPADKRDEINDRDFSIAIPPKQTSNQSNSNSYEGPAAGKKKPTN